MALHPGHMGVAENRHPIGREVESAARRAGDAFVRLERQPVDEVEVEGSHPERPRGLRADRRLLIGLLAADRRLDRHLKILHAEAHASDAHRTERLATVVGERSRVDLNGDLSVLAKGEARLQPLHDRHEAVAGERCRRAAAPMHVRHCGPASDPVRDAVDLARQLRRIGPMGRFESHHLRIAAAVEAEPIAERHVQIEGERRVKGQFGKPARVDACANAGRKMRRGRIARVTRHAPVMASDESRGFKPFAGSERPSGPHGRSLHRHADARFAAF